MSDRADVCIVGAGVMGCLVAYRLAQHGKRVVVLERSIPGAEASSAAAGILGPGVEAHFGFSDGHPHPGARPEADLMLELGIYGRERYAALAQELRDGYSLEFGFRRPGVLRVATNAAEAEDLQNHHSLLHGRVKSSLLDRAALHALEPAMGPTIESGLYIEEDAQLDPRAMLSSVVTAARRAGVRFVSGTIALGLHQEGGRVRGVQCQSEVVLAEDVVLAAGSWTHLLQGVSMSQARIHPVRGQIVQTTFRPPVFERIVFGAGGYVVSRADGTTLCGSTEERVGYERGVTFDGMARVLHTARTLAPTLASAPVEAHWSSFRPGTADGLPIVGATATPGLWMASGHYRNGILLAPTTADLLTAQMTGAMDLPATLLDAATALSPKRFAIEAARV